MNKLFSECRLVGLSYNIVDYSIIIIRPLLCIHWSGATRLAWRLCVILQPYDVLQLKKLILFNDFLFRFLLNFFFGSYIEGREIRCAVVESAANGELKALSCIEYKVRENDIRRTEDKLSCNEKGLPVGKYWRYTSLIPPTTPVINICATKPHFQGVVRLLGFPAHKCFESNSGGLVCVT